MKIISQHRALVALAAASWAVAVAQADSPLQAVEWQLRPATEVVEAVPPLPPPTTFPVQLVLDDDSSEGVLGVAGATARQFLWFNRFTAGAGFHLEEVWVLFPSGANMAVGGAIQIAIYEDPDGDPSNGANLLASFNDTIQAADGNTFSLYTVPGAPTIPVGSDLLVGVVPRFIASGVTSPTFPAALDTTSTQGRSWLAAWSTDPPDPPVLVPLPDQTLSLVDDFFPGGGNFMIRAFGSPQGVTEIPALDGLGLAALALALLAAGAFVLRRRKSAASISLVLLSLAGPAGAVTIDTFTTNQAAISDPGTVSSSVAGVAGDPIGTNRGMVVDLLTGAGPTTASVAAGNLVLTVTATTPDSRGEVLVSWDGDTNALVLSPTGLGNANLTTGNASGFQLDFVSTTVVTEIEITVYDDAANFSRAVRRVPISGAAQSVRIPFAEFRIAGGTGANFASVGAIEMTVRGGEGTITLNQVTTTAPTVAATKVDTLLIDNDGDTRADPGDRVRYTVTVTNTGNQALAVDLTDTIDANTTLVAGSVSSTPVAHNDQYGWYGNVTFSTDGSATRPNLLANDQDGDGDTLTVQAGTFPATSAQGGTLTLVSAATGAFTYSPPAGFAGVDSFNYTAIDDNGNTALATANIALEGVVWFVDRANTTAPFLGTQADPFQFLPEAETPSGAGDIIYVRFNGTSYDTGGANGFVMDPDQQLLGEGVALILNGTTIIPAGGYPGFTNNDGTPGRGVTLATTGTQTLRGMSIFNTGGAKIFGNPFGTLATDSIDLLGSGQALDLSNGTVAATFSSITSGASAATGINLSQVHGSLTSTGGTTITSPTAQGILLGGSTVTASFGNTSVTGGNNGVELFGNSSGTRTFGTLSISGGTGIAFRHDSGGGNVSVIGAASLSSGNTPVDIQAAASGNTITFAGTTVTKTTGGGGAGVNLVSNTGATITFSTLSVTTSNGPGIFASGGGTLSLGGTSNTVTSTGGAALDISGMSFGAGATFATVTSTNSTGKGINLNNNTGALTMNGGSITTPGTIAFDLNAGSANVTYAGSITHTSNNAMIEITSRTGGTTTLSGNLSGTGSSDGIRVASNSGGTYNFSGTTKTLSTGADIAVSLTTNTGSTINFTGGGLDIDTTSGTGFNATGGATAITVQGTVNTIDSTTGTALNVANSTIGASGLTFQRISSNGGANGIVLDNTGSSAGLTLTGTGAANSGGTIQAKTGAAIILNSTRNISFTSLLVNCSVANDDDGIRGTNVTNFTLASSTVQNCGEVVLERGIEFTNLLGTSSITSSTITGSAEDNLYIKNGTGTLVFSASSSTFSNNSATVGNDGIHVLGADVSGSNNANMTISVTNCTFTNHRGDHFQATTDAASGATIDVTFTNNDLNNAVGANLGAGLTLNPGGAANMTFDISNNGTAGDPFAGAFSSAIMINSSNSSQLSGTINNNVIGNAAVVDSGSFSGDGITVFANGTSQLTIAVTNNTIRQYSNLAGINVHVRDNFGSPGGGSLHATVTGNTVSNPGTFASNGVLAQAGSVAGDDHFLCVDIGGAGILANSIAGSSANGATDFRVRQRQNTTVRLPGYAGANSDTAAVIAFIQGRNTGAETGSATTQNVPGTGGGFVGGAACNQP